MARWLEFVLATLLLVLLSGLLLVCGVVVALTSIGPVIFRQRRIGRGGRLFTLLKFRTMHHNAEGISLTLNDDPRITRVGAWLRRTHLDELPQLMNILVGHMSFVGPRPEVPEFVDVIQRNAPELLGVRPGLTDEGTIGALDEGARLQDQIDPSTYYREVLLPEKLARSAEALKGRTTLTDLRVMIRTVGALLRPKRRKESLDEALV